MSRMKSSFIRMVSWEDLFLSILLSWLGKKLLDYVWEKGKIRIRLEGETHLARYLFVMFGEDALLFVFGWLIGIPYQTQDVSRPQDVTDTEFHDSLLRFLILHRRYHDYVRNRSCRVCPVILFSKNSFKNTFSTQTYIRLLICACPHTLEFNTMGL